MVEFPEGARRHLSRGAGGDDHPDAGLLTAFVEGTLTATLRDGVLDHVTSCSDCNSVIALIAPEDQVANVARPRAVRRHWFVLTPVRWVMGSAAVAMLVATLWIGRMNWRIEPPVNVRTAVAETPASPSVTAQRRSPPRAARQSGESRAATNQAQHETQRESAAAKRQPAVPENNRSAGIAAHNRPADPGLASGQEAFQTSIISGVPAPGDLPHDARVPSQPSGTAETPKAMNVRPPLEPNGPIWSVSDKGLLQRSIDSGHTWVAVPIPTRAVLRVVAVLGQDVWAGGDQGALYQSNDSGQSWTIVIPTSSGKALSADILRIGFLTSRHGWIATREGNVWTTHDGGATWESK